CHELTHLDGRMGKGHGEEFVSAREDLGHATGHLLPAIAVLVQKVLGLPARPSEDQKRIGKLERQLERARRQAGESRKAAAEGARRQAARDEARAGRGDAHAESARVGAACGKACATCGCETSASYTTPGTRLRWGTLGEWLHAWREIQGRQHSAARYA